MNLDPLGPRDEEEPLAPSEWSLDVQREGIFFRGVVKRMNTEMCRIGVVAEGLDERTARTALAHKARVWIKDYVSRGPLVQR